MPHNLQK